MKNTLLQRVKTLSNLRRAWMELNKTRPFSRGLSSETILSFGMNLESNLKNLRKQLGNGTFEFSPVRAVTKTKKKVSGKIKKRGLRIAEIRDRVVQRAIARVIEPILEKHFDLRNEASFAYLKGKGKGVRPALMRIISLYQEHNPHVFEADIEKFFDTVDKEKLLNEMIFPKLPDASLNTLIKESLEQAIGNLNSIADDDLKLFPETGIPQGGALSPLFANVYLSEFDKEMLQAGFGLIRYADDFVVMAKTAGDAKRAEDLSRSIIEGRLKLKLHEDKTRTISVTKDHFEFLGVRYNGQRIWPAKDRINELKAKIRITTEFRTDKKLGRVLPEMSNVIQGWISSYCFTDVEPYLAEIESYIRERIGICACRMGWLNKECALSVRQYRFSGIPNLKEFLLKQRGSLSSSEKSIFTI